MAQNRGFKLIDVSSYLNQFSQVQIAAVWHSTEPKYKVEKPLEYQSTLQQFVYETLMIPFQIPGVLVVLSKDGEVIVNEAFGFSNVRQQVPACSNKYHRIASISKVFTKYAILRQVEQKKLSLQDRVFEDVFGDLFNCKLSSGSELITVDHLINHMVGAWSTKTRSEDPIPNKE